MLEDSPIFNDEFWKIISYLDQINGKIDARVMMDELNIGEKDLIDVLTFLGHFDMGVSLEMENMIPVIHREESKPIVFELSFCEWMALQAHFPLFDKYKDKEFSRELRKKLSVVEKENENTSFFDAMESWAVLKKATSSGGKEEGIFVEQIEKAFHGRLLLDIKLEKGTLLELYPHRMVYFDGRLNLIGEETGIDVLFFFPIRDIESLDSKLNTDYRANFSRLEIHDFVSAIRTVTGNEERLVLKISDPDELNLERAHHFISNPYVTSNSQGDIIWAANVEACDNLYEWLNSIDQHIEVLDPLSIKEGFDEHKALKEVKKVQKKPADMLQMKDADGTF